MKGKRYIVDALCIEMPRLESELAFLPSFLFFFLKILDSFYI